MGPIIFPVSCLAKDHICFNMSLTSFILSPRKYWTKTLGNAINLKQYILFSHISMASNLLSAIYTLHSGFKISFEPISCLNHKWMQHRIIFYSEQRYEICLFRVQLHRTVWFMTWNLDNNKSVLSMSRNRDGIRPPLLPKKPNKVRTVGIMADIRYTFQTVVKTHYFNMIQRQTNIYSGY